MVKELRKLHALAKRKWNPAASRRCFASLPQSQSSGKFILASQQSKYVIQGSLSTLNVGTSNKRRMLSSLSKEAATQAADFPPHNRWMAVPPANLVHLSIGGVYVYSMWTPAMTQALGVISSAPLDWTHSQVLPVFSCAALSLGLTTHFFGGWVEQAGPRRAGMVGSLFWSMGLITTGAGVYLHELPLIYAGYSVFGGIGWGLMYLSPVTTVMKWFPDRRGLATGIALSAFGVGAAIAPAMIHTAMEYFAVTPDFIGPLTSSGGAVGDFVALTTLSDGSQVVADHSLMGTPGQPVVVATEGDINKFHNIETGPGAYALGTGDTGAAKALWAMGSLYGCMGILGSRFMMLPNSNWTPTGPVMEISNDESKRRNLETSQSSNKNDIGLPSSYVTSSTTQYPLLWLSVFGNATGGLALLSSSKLMMTDIWAGVAPSVVTASFTTGYVSALGIGMAAGRFGWSALSDSLGRKNTYAIFGLGIPVVGLAPYLAHAAADMALVGESNDAILPYLGVFYSGSILAITFYGGLFSALPAYIADLFGQKHAGAIHGKLLTAWAASAVVGPMGLGYMRNQSVSSAIKDLLETLDAEGGATEFEQSFGCSLEDTEAIQRLMDAKTISIGRLMELMPDGTVDPTPFIYDTTCYAAAGLMGVSLLANLAIRPLDFVKIASDLDKNETPAKE